MRKSVRLRSVGITSVSTPATTGGGQKQNWALIYGIPLFMGYLLRNFPAGMWLYWLLTTIFQVGQQWLINLEIGRLEPVAPEPELEPGEDEEEGDEG
jgi:membrane protein insertase Oxa1/YidC/SpoIIIJ